ncbi:MAG: lipocalin-like domain-containing protein [Betaproteobacteria bacterium]|nr:MAG: lipocalin-like domain-containing protein [Betaproteobacteria bacterium]
MNRRYALGVIAVAAAALAGNAAAQTTKTVAGTYSPVTVSAYGDKPRGQLILTPDGRYSIVLSRAEMPKIASGSRVKATPEENKAVVDGSIAHAGRYTIDDGGRSITFHIETSTFPNWNGTTQKRPLSLKGDLLTYTVATPSAGGAPNDAVWRRAK